MKRILIVDDEENMLAVLEMLFRGAGFETVTAGNGAEALEAATRGSRFDVVVSDLKMPDLNGIDLLGEIRKRGCETPFVLITAYGTVEIAVEAMKLGAVDVITKPFTKEILLNVVNRVCRLESLQTENRILKGQAETPELLFASTTMAQILEVLRKVGPAPTPVLITGESGTGKELVARTLHQFYEGGERRPYVSVNCPAVPETLLESELFGYKRGAFTGAIKDFRGKVELAGGGTLFFDEIGDLPAGLQPKLLRLLENKTYEPLGYGMQRKVDLRILCATNRDLRRLVQEGRFREDLYYRINTITVNVPALRDRCDDVPVLADFFTAKYARELGKPHTPLSREVLDLLKAYPWPGNVRELRNVIERAVVLCAGGVITPQDLPPEIREARKTLPGPGRNGHNLLDETERRMIQEVLDSTTWNVSEAARKLGITRNTLRYRMQKHHLGL